MNGADEHFEKDEWLVGRSLYFNKIMVVEFNTGGTNFIPVRQPAVQKSDATPANESSVSFSTQTLQQTFQQASQARPEKVAQANALLSDPSYPSDAALNQLAGFFANRI